MSKEKKVIETDAGFISAERLAKPSEIIDTNFIKMPMTQHFEALTHLDFARQSNMVLDPIVNKGTAIINKDISFLLENFDKSRQAMSEATDRTIDIITAYAYKENKARLFIPIKGYMALTNIDNYNYAREKFLEDVKLLFKDFFLKIPILDSYGKPKKDGSFFHYIIDYGIHQVRREALENDAPETFLRVTIHPDIFQLITQGGYVPAYLTESSFKLDIKRYPGSRRLYKKILHYRNINHKQGSFTLSVKTLLEVLPNILSAEEKKNKKMSFEKARLEPFNRILDYIAESTMLPSQDPQDLGKLVPSFLWEYCGKNGSIADEPMNDIEFDQAYIKFTFKGYPEIEAPYPQLEENTYNKRVKRYKRKQEKKREKVPS